MYSFLQALQLLNFLIVDSSNNLQQAIGGLDPFPDIVQFKKINKCYKQIRKDRTSLSEVLRLIYMICQPDCTRAQIMHVF